MCSSSSVLAHQKWHNAIQIQNYRYFVLDKTKNKNETKKFPLNMRLLKKIRNITAPLMSLPYIILELTINTQDLIYFECIFCMLLHSRKYTRTVAQQRTELWTLKTATQMTSNSAHARVGCISFYFAVGLWPHSQTRRFNILKCTNRNKLFSETPFVKYCPELQYRCANLLCKATWKL